MSLDVSWGASLGSQMLAEISLLEAKAKIPNEENNGLSTSCAINEVSIVAGSDHSAHEDSKSISLSVTLDDHIIPENSRSKSLIEIVGSNPSEQKSALERTSSNCEKRTSSLSGPVRSPLSCSTPVGNPAFNLRRASLRSSSALKLQLQNWGLPSSVVQKYSEKKITTLFPWQVECLQTGKVLCGGNLIYSAPTSSGKTLVSELLMLKTVIEQKRKGIFINFQDPHVVFNVLNSIPAFKSLIKNLGLYILPFVAVAREKTRFLKNITEDVGIRVESFAGSCSPPGGLKNCDLAICTIEKANSLINRLIEEGTLDQLGIVVVDELHLIGDSHRGYLLELLLTKILYASSRSGQRTRTQIVGMSATLPNLEVLAKWLRADLYRTDFRPIPLKEHVKIGTDIFKSDFRLARKIDTSRLVPNDIDHIIYLCLETILDTHSVLMFCPTKNWCEKMALNISGEFFNLGSSSTSHYGSQLRQQLKGDLLAQVLERLKATPAGLDGVLGQTIRFAVAFHHAGLTTEEREIIETAFRHGVVRVLVATSTLSSGVNLPARRVIIRTPIFHGTTIDPLVYRQMIGRAGRYGVDTDGDSYLICQPTEKHQVERMFNAIPPALKSCLLLEQTNLTDPSLVITSSMKRAMLEVIATGSASSAEDLKLYATCTLLSVLNDVPEAAIQACITWLVGNEFIRRQTVDDGKERLTPTQLGLACLASSLSPDESLVLLNELKTARRGLILDSDLHLVYQITPTYVSDQMNQIDWLHYLTLWEDLNESQKRVGEAVGVEERFLIRAMKGTITTAAPRQSRQMAIHRRFYTALALNELMNEVRLANVAQTYKMNKGTLQSLQQQTATFAGMVTIFCHRLGWNTLYVLLEHFQSRLLFGVQLELVDLMRLPSMLSHTARLLYDAGLTNVSSVATAAPENIEVLLKNACPFESAKDNDEAKKLGETDVDAYELVAEARKLLQLELGVKIQWNNSIKSDPIKPKPMSQEIMRSQEIVRQSPLLPINESNSINNKSTSLHRLNSPLASSPTGAVTPVQHKTITPTSRSMKENTNPANITPDMFQESSIDSSSQSLAVDQLAVESLHRSPTDQPVKQVPMQTPLSKAVESLRLSDDELCDTVKTPHFAACAEKLVPVTVKPLFKCVKRRVSIDDISFLEATPPNKDCISRLVAKKTKLSPPPVSFVQAQARNNSSILSFSSDDSSIIPSSLPIPKFKIEEITTCSRLELFIKDSTRHSLLAISVYKEKNSILGLAVAWSCDTVHYIQLRTRFDSNLEQSKVSKLRSWLEALKRSKTEFIVYDIRSTVKDLRSLFHHVINQMLFRDVDLCQWLLEPSNPSVSVQKLGKLYSQQSPSKTYRGREKLLHDCCSLLDIFFQVKKRLIQVELYQPFVEVEMPMVSLMLRMEETGIGFDRSNCEMVLQLLRQHMTMIEENAHRLAGRQFSLNSTKETAKVLATLNLCVEEKTPQSFINPLKKKYQPPSVTKAALIKLGRIHPLPKLVVEYRKVHAIVQNIVCPLLQASTFHVDGIERIAGECEFRNVTGRVNIVQPNLQHIPRPFTLSDGRMMNIRTAFVAIPGTTLLSADYSQLELRILAHLSEDAGLCSILSQPDGDVFRGIVSAWKRKKVSEVTDDERQQAKQICYGIVYGIGCKSLAEQLEVSEEEAQLFVDTFHATYPGIEKFINTTINQCRSKGFVMTLLGRRRFLPAINSNNLSQKAQAERQAVNTKIQGSAADLVKTALILVNRTLQEKFADVHLVHQIHDELLYQIPNNSLDRAACVVQRCMETAIPMKIRLPVAIKTGKTWGSMEPYKK